MALHGNKDAERCDFNINLIQNGSWSVLTLWIAGMN